MRFFRNVPEEASKMSGPALQVKALPTDPHHVTITAIESLTGETLLTLLGFCLVFHFYISAFHV